MAEEYVLWRWKCVVTAVSIGLGMGLGVPSARCSVKWVKEDTAKGGVMRLVVL